MPTTRRCRSSRRARQTPAGSGPTSETTGLRREAIRRRRSTTSPQGIDDKSIPTTTWQVGVESCRPTPMAATTAFTVMRASPGPVSPGALQFARPQRLLRTSPTSRLQRAVARARRLSRRLHSRPCVASMRSSRSSATSTALCAAERYRVRQEQSPAADRGSACRLRRNALRSSRSSSVAKPINYMLKAFGPLRNLPRDDGAACLSNNNAAERALRGFALGRKSWLFAGPTAARIVQPPW